jgi:uncharacterized protein YcnI
VTIASAGDTATLTFTGTAGQRVSLNMTNSTIGNFTTVTIKSPSGTTVKTSYGINFYLDTMTLPANGTYTIVIDPNGTITGQITATLYDVQPDFTAPITPGGASVTATTTVPGQGAALTFSGSAGQRVSLNMTNSTIGNFTTVTIKSPSGTNIKNSYGINWFLDTVSLPANGTYTIVIDPTGTLTGQITATLYDVQPDFTASITPGGASVTATTTVPGQGAALTFSGSAGQRVSLNMTNSTIGNFTTVTIKSPSGTNIKNSYGINWFLDTVSLPANGSYTIVIDPNGTLTGQITATLYDVPPDSGGPIAPGTSVTVTTTVPGQNGILSFNGIAGHSVSLYMTGSTIGNFTTVSIKNPSGGMVKTNYGISNFGVGPATLPVDGIYTIMVDPTGTLKGQITVALTTSPPDVTGTITIGGPPVPVVTAPNQRATLTFSANGGQQINLRTSESTYTADVTVKNGATTIAHASGSNFTLNAITLSSTATYTIVIAPTAGGSLWVTLSPAASSQYTDAPTISGLPSTGVTLLGTTQPWTPTPNSFSFQWVRCSLNGLVCTEIAAATEISYKPVAFDVGYRLRIRMTAINNYGTSVAQSLPTAPITKILDRYAPQMQYDSQENYRADSPAEITDNRQPAYSNRLLDGTDGVIATSADALNLDYLGPSYPGGRSAAATDHLEEADSHEADAQRMNGDPTYGNKTYGRILPSNLLGGGQILQYWFFYYFNPFPLDNHQGDWEMIQLELDSTGTPYRATYAQHKGGVSCDWGHVQQTSDQHPIVYPGLGSHASFFRTGSPSAFGIPPAAPNDYNDGAGPSIRLEVIDMPTSGWINWPGTWGSSSASPNGPARQGLQSDGGEKWNAPMEWANNATACTEIAARARARTSDSPRTSRRSVAPRPPLPSIRAHRSEKRAFIDYAFPSLPQTLARRPWKILTAIDSAGNRYAAFTKWSAVQSQRGTIIQPLGLGHSPFRVLLSVFSQTGARSRTISVPLK